VTSASGISLSFETTQATWPIVQGSLRPFTIFSSVTWCLSFLIVGGEKACFSGSSDRNRCEAWLGRISHQGQSLDIYQHGHFIQLSTPLIYSYSHQKTELLRTGL
jgi:hypothetical protein